MKQEEERISFLSSHNLCWNVKGLADLFMQEGGGILRSNFWLWILWCYMKTRIHLDVLYIQVVIYSIYINLFSLHAGDCIRTNSILIVSSKIVHPFAYLLKIGPTQFVQFFLTNYLRNWRLVRAWCFSLEIKSLFTCDTLAFLCTLWEIYFSLVRSPNRALCEQDREFAVKSLILEFIFYWISLQYLLL